MKERKLRAFRWSLIFFIISIMIFFIVPMRGSGGFIEKEYTYWPFNLLSDKSLIILSNYRIWFIGQWVVFFGVIILLEPLCYMFKIPKNRIVKIIMLVLFFLCFLPLIYFTIGSVLHLGAYPPMKFDTWLNVFGTRKNYLYVWWIFSAVLLKLGLKF